MCNSKVSAVHDSSVHFDEHLFTASLENSSDVIHQLTTKPPPEQSNKNVRLSSTVFPYSYDLLLQVHIHLNESKDFFFNGTVTINVISTVSTKEFFVHAYHNLNISLDQVRVGIVRHKDFHSLSNMALQSTEILDNNWRLDRYEPSVNMSSYLLAFVVSQFSKIEGKDSRGRNYGFGDYARHSLTFSFNQFTVWARPNKINSAKYAFDIDMIAVPNYEGGAMENWGLITYRESALLWDPETDLAWTKYWVASIVSHELAHQDEAFPLYDTQTALAFDSSAYSHPVIHSVNYPHEIAEMFDSISYSKVTLFRTTMEHKSMESKVDQDEYFL
ncbi:unnamed protein product [Heterobilharzia americana]|nr:unnamed protein product [Heterobilharzia americana]